MKPHALLLAAAVVPLLTATPQARAAETAAETAGAAAAPHRSGLAEQTISYGELFAIGTGALLGTTLAAAMIDHGLGFIGTLLGAWAGDYYYYHYALAGVPAPATP